MTIPVTKSVTIRVHATQPRSQANGPGTRYTLWVQGCSLGCAGCFNQETHQAAGAGTPVADVIDDIVAQAETGHIEGLTISGGEPMEQPEAVLALLSQVRTLTDLSVLMFSGYTRAEIAQMALGPAIEGQLDVLIDGRYESTQRLGRDLQGSANQGIHLLTDRYTKAQVAATPEAEIRIAADGSFTVTGVAPMKIR